MVLLMRAGSSFRRGTCLFDQQQIHDSKGTRQVAREIGQHSKLQSLGGRFSRTQSVYFPSRCAATGGGGGNNVLLLFHTASKQASNCHLCAQEGPKRKPFCGFLSYSTLRTNCLAYSRSPCQSSPGVSPMLNGANAGTRLSRNLPDFLQIVLSSTTINHPHVHHSHNLNTPWQEEHKFFVPTSSLLLVQGGGEI